MSRLDVLSIARRAIPHLTLENKAEWIRQMVADLPTEDLATLANVIQTASYKNMPSADNSKLCTNCSHPRIKDSLACGVYIVCPTSVGTHFEGELDYFVCSCEHPFHNFVEV